MTVTIRGTDGRLTTATTPCLLQSWEDIDSLEVVDKKYWPFSVGSHKDGGNILRYSRETARERLVGVGM